MSTILADALSEAKTSSNNNSAKNNNSAAHVKKIIEDLPTLSELKSKHTLSMPLQQLQMLVMMAREQPQLLQRFPQVIKDLNKLEKLRKLEKVNQNTLDSENLKLWSDWVTRYYERLYERKIRPSGDEIKARIKVMNAHNPTFVLRNYMLQDAISAAEKGDYARVNALLKLVQNPYLDVKTAAEEQEKNGLTEDELVAYAGKPPKRAANLRVT